MLLKEASTNGRGIRGGSLVGVWWWDRDTLGRPVVDARSSVDRPGRNRLERLAGITPWDAAVRR